MQPLSGNQRPDILTALMKMSLVLRLPRKMHLCRSFSNVQPLPSFLEMLQHHHVLLTFDTVHSPLRLPRGTTSKRPKVVRTPGVFYMLTSKCASRHNGVHFFDSATSKSAPNMSCFVHFDLEMCFAPQRRALFQQLNFQKWSEGEVLLAFSLASVLRATTVCFFSTSQLPKVVRNPNFFTCWLRNVLRATMACIFSTAQLPKVLRTCRALYILTWKCASRHNGVQFFISHLRWLGTRRFSEPTFRPSGATNHWKNMEKHSVLRLSYLFAHLHLLSFDSLFSILLWSSLLYSSLLSDSSHLCFSSVHIVGSLTSKLPSSIPLI